MKDQTFRIRQARRIATLSQTALADKVGVNRSAVAQWERPGGSQPTAGNLCKIAIATCIQFEWLATGRGRMTAQCDEEDAEEVPALLLKFYARDEIEERALFALRKLEQRLSIAIVEMAERMSRAGLAD
jgi:transcriptional regulator with XRE-family HTH domain